MKKYSTIFILLCFSLCIFLQKANEALAQEKNSKTFEEYLEEGKRFIKTHKSPSRQFLAFQEYEKAAKLAKTVDEFIAIGRAHDELDIENVNTDDHALKNYQKAAELAASFSSYLTLADEFLSYDTRDKANADKMFKNAEKLVSNFEELYQLIELLNRQYLLDEDGSKKRKLINQLINNQGTKKLESLLARFNTNSEKKYSELSDILLEKLEKNRNILADYGNLIKEIKSESANNQLSNSDLKNKQKTLEKELQELSSELNQKILKFSISKDSDNNVTWSQILLILPLILFIILLNNIIWWRLFRRQKQYKDITNPYKAGQALGKDDWFFGRIDILNFIESNLVTAKAPHSITLYGVRRMGKSSILKRIHYADYLSVYITFDDIAIDIESNNNFFVEVKEVIQEQLAGQRIAMPEQDVTDKKSFEKFMLMLNSSLNNRRVIIMIDEFQKISSLIRENRLSEDLPGFLRNLVQNLNNIGFIFCGTDAIKEMTADYFAAFFNLTLSRKVSFLDKKDAIDLVVKPVQGEIKYHKRAIHRIIDLTNGHAYFVQLVCHELVSKIKSTSSRCISKRHVNEVVNELLEKGDAYFSYATAAKAGLLNKLLLSIIAEKTKKKEYIQLDQILNILKNNQINDIQRQTTLDKLRDLCEKDFLEEQKEQPGFRLTIGLIRLWLQKKAPLTKVISEYNKNHTQEVPAGKVF